MRLFIGIPVADAVVAQIESACAMLRSGGDDWRWATPESWHITLQFLGKTSEEQHRCVAAALGKLRWTQASVRLGAMGFFDRAGVLFIDVEVMPDLLSLQRQVTAATEPCGYAPESRPYHPHITLARIKGRDTRPGIGKLESKINERVRFSNFTAKEIILYESLLEPTGSKYEVRARFPLGS